MSLNLPICHACNTTLSRKQRASITENVTNPPYLGAQLKKCDHVEVEEVGLGLGRQSCFHDWDLVLGSVVYIAFANKSTPRLATTPGRYRDTFPATIPDWNSLSEATVDAATINRFKGAIHNHN